MEYYVPPVRSCIVKKTQPLAIPGSLNKSSSEYSLKKNFFDPNKSSPPNSWNSRLLSRIENYNNYDYDNKIFNFSMK